MTAGRSFKDTADGPLPRTGAEELAAGSGPAAGNRGAVVDFVRSEEAEALSGTMVELSSESGALTLGEGGEVGPLGQILAEEPIGVLVGAALPGVVRSGEVEGGVELPLEGFVHVELGAVVGGDGVDGMRFVAQQRDGALESFVGADASDLADADEAALAFDDGDGGGFAAAVDGVDLPVAKAGPVIDHCRAFSDHALAGEPAAAVVGGVALAFEFASAAQMAPEGAAARLVSPDMQVDRFVAHDAYAFDAQAANDLHRTELLAQHAFDRDEVRWAIAAIATRAGTATVGLLHRVHPAVEAVVDTAVAFDLTIDGTRMTAQGGRYLSDRMPFCSHRCDRVSFILG